MTVARHYVMMAKAGSSAALETALAVLADDVRALPGSEGVELLRDAGNEHRFVFIEKWTTVEAHKNGGDALGKEALSAVMSAIDGPPEGAYLDYLKVV